MKIMENKWYLFILPRNVCSDFRYWMKGMLVLLLFLFLSSTDTFGQQSTVSGTVKDQQGNTLIGVTVLVKGTSFGALTDVDGKYTVQNVPDNATLVFSFVGMTPQEVPVGGRTTVDIAMAEGAIGLDEIVVVGYGTQTKKTLSGAVSNVNEAALQTSV